MALAVTTGITACGDKVNVTQPPADSSVQQVTVSPPGPVPMSVGDKVTFSAAVIGGPQLTNRAVTWSSANSAIASVDQNGVVTAVAGGTTSIIATSKANTAISGAAVVTVGAVVQPTVTISTINQTTGAGSVPAVLGNVVGQLDVTLNVDPGTQSLTEVDLVATVNGKDTVVASQSRASSNLTPAVAEAASSPVTLSFNTAFFNATTGAVAFTNGNITIKGVAKTTQGTQSASSNTALTLNNADALVGSMTTGATAPDALGQSWNGKSVTVTVVPVLYTPGRAAASTNIGLFAPAGVNGDGLSKNQNISTAGSVSATYTDGNGASGTVGAATDIDGVTNIQTVANASIIDNAGQNFANAAAPANTPSGGTVFVSSPIFTPASVLAAAPKALPAFRLDTKKPRNGNFHIAPNVDQNINPGTGYVGAAFKFTGDSSSGYRGPDSTVSATANLDSSGANPIPGVGRVHVTFIFRTGNSGSFTTITNTQNISESVANNTYSLRVIATDTLGNADTSATQTFGVDKTPPSVAVNATPANDTVTNTTGGLGSYGYTISDNLSGPALSQLVAVVRQFNGLASVSGSNEGRINSNIVAQGFTGVGTSGSGSTLNPCYIGRFNATQAAAGTNAIPIFSASGSALGFCTPVLYSAPTSLATSFPSAPTATGTDGYWTATVIGLDEAANQTVGFTRTILEDATAPVVVNIDPPPTAVGNGSVAWPTNVNDNPITNTAINGGALSVGDLVGSFITQGFAAGQLQFPTQAGPGTAFDNVLTFTATLSPTLTNYIKNIQTVAPAAAAVAPVAGGNNTAVQVTAIGAADLGPGAPSRGSLTFVFQPGAPQLVAGSSTTWPNGLTGGWTIEGPDAADTSVTTLSNCPAKGCTGGATATHGTSVKITATAIGATQTFANPLTGGAVTFWYRVHGSAGPWFLASPAGSGSSRDNGVNRFWDFSLTFDPPLTAPDGTDLTVTGTMIDVVAIGVNAAGDAIMNDGVTAAFGVYTITLVNP